jgi:hypothetical protein
VRGSRGFAWAWALGVAVAVAAALVGIWWPPYTPGQDTPQHLFFARVLAEPSRFEVDYRVNLALTSQGFVYLAALFEPLGLVVAGKLVRTLGLGLLLAAYWVLGRAAGERHPVGLLFAAAASASFFHAMGFENFALAVPLGLLALGLGLRVARLGGARRWALLGVVLALTSFGHAVTAGMVGLELALVVALAAPAGWVRWRRLGALAVAVLPAAVHAAVATWLSAGGQADYGYAEGLGTQRLGLGEQLENVWATSFGGYSELGGLLVGAAVALALAAWVKPGEALVPARQAARRVALTAALLWLAVYAVTPFHGVGWAFAQPRVLVLAVLFPVGLLPWGRWRGPLLAVTVTAAVAFLASSAWQQRQSGEAIEAQVARLGGAPVGRAMAVTLDAALPPTSRFVEPLAHVELYAVARGGAVPSVFAANSATQAVLARRPPQDWPPHPPAYIRRSLDCGFNPDCLLAARVLMERIAVLGVRYDHVLLIGGPESYRERLVARGYERLAPDRFAARPGGLELLVSPAPELARYGLVVRGGYPGGLGWFTGAERPPGPVPETGGAMRVPLGPLPGGPLALECRWVRSAGERERLETAPVACRGEAVVVPGESRAVTLELLRP